MDHAKGDHTRNGGIEDNVAEVTPAKEFAMLSHSKCGVRYRLPVDRRSVVERIAPNS